MRGFTSYLHAILQLSNNGALRDESEEATLHLVGHWNDKAEEDAYLQHEEGKHLRKAFQSVHISLVACSRSCSCADIVVITYKCVIERHFDGVINRSICSS